MIFIILVTLVTRSGTRDILTVISETLNEGIGKAHRFKIELNVWRGEASKRLTKAHI